MEFLTSTPHQPPKNLYPCLATITISPNHPTSERSRRLSSGSTGGGDDGNPLQRVISGGRRKSSFGDIAVTGGGGERRKSFVGANEEGSGKWYWRVQAGVTDTHLILLPLSQPPNSLLTTPPPPLSQAMPAHSTHPAAGTRTQNLSETQPHDEEKLTDKIKHFFRRSSSTTHDQPHETNESESSTSTATAVEGGHDKIVDQTARGEQLPGAAANAVGATNVNANAELGWPGVLNGEKLGAIVVDLRGVQKGKVELGGGKKDQGSYVTVPVTSQFANMVQGMIEPVGNNHHQYPKSGTIKFEFDKDWIGAKGEAELLHHYLTQAVTELPTSPHQGHAERAIPQNTEFQLGSGHAHAG